MSAPGPRRHRSWGVIKRERAVRLRDLESSLTADLDRLYETDRHGYDSLMAMWRRVIMRETERGR
jgi:hypothetical protein